MVAAEEGGGQRQQAGTFTARGTQAIADRVASWGLRGAAAEIASVDAQYSAGGGVLVQVTGTLSAMSGGVEAAAGGAAAGEEVRRPTAAAAAARRRS